MYKFNFFLIYPTCYFKRRKGEKERERKRGIGIGLDKEIKVTCER